jgi:predicted permease
MSWRRYFLRARWHRERQAELEAYLEEETAANQARGMDARQARAAAQRKLGNETLVLERIYRMNTVAWLDTLGRDLRYALRLLRRSPGFTAVAVLSLALGIGGNLAVLGMMDAVMRRPLPAPQARQLVRLDWTSHQWEAQPGWGTSFDDSAGRTINTSFSYPMFQHWQQSNRTLSGLAAFRPLTHIDIFASGHAEPGHGSLVSGSYQTVLGLRPALGRGISEADLAPNAPPVAVLDYGYWKSRLGGERAVLGRTIQVNHLPVTVVGVEPEGFQGLEVGFTPDVYLPMSLVERGVMQGWAHPPRLSDNSYWWVEVVGRLRPGRTLPQATADLNLGFEQMVKALPVKATDHGDRPVLMADSAAHGVNNLGQDFALPMLILLALTGLVMLIVCINLANLLLARAAARESELAVRLAIGAGRRALVRQLLTESLVLALLGGLASLPVGVLALRAILQAFVPPEMDIRPGWDGLMLAAALGLALAAGLIMGLIPAWRSTRMARRRSLAGAARPGAGRNRLGEALLVAQMALCLLVIAGAGLFQRTLHNLQRANLGLDASHVTVFEMDAPLEGYSGTRLAAFYQQVLDRLRGLPGVSAATETDIIPGSTSMSSTHSLGLAPGKNTQRNPVTYVAKIAPGYFTAYRIPLTAGRELNAGDTADAPRVVVINRTLAERFHGYPVGQQLYDNETGEGMTVVGVAADAAYHGVRDLGVPVVYFPLSQKPSSSVYFAVRSELPAAVLTSALRGAVSAVDPEVPVYGLQTQAEAMRASYDSQILMAGLTSLLGGLALLLAAIGLYGLMAYNVTRRTREIGVRVALGASRGSVSGMVLRQSLRLVAVGVWIGLPLAWLASRAMTGLLYKVSPGDPWAFGGAIVFLAAVAVGAAWWPARRAAKVDPMTSLREG